MRETNRIILMRKNKIIIDDNNFVSQNQSEQALMLAMIKNFESLGFTVSKDLFDKLCKLSKNQLEQFYKGVMPCLREKVGADVEYNPMYPNFPRQVMEASDAELFVNAIVHYFTYGNWMPGYTKDERLPLIDDNKMTVLSVGTYDDLIDVFKNLVSSKTSLSPQDKKDLETIITNCSDYEKYLPDEIPLKENVALICKIMLEKAPIVSVEYVKRYFKTATDVLRLITLLSDGDVSLASRTKYRSLRRKERRMVMGLLENCGNIIEDMFRYRQEWIRIGEIVHPFEFNKNKYEHVYNAFEKLRNNDKPLMFGGKVQLAISSMDMYKAASLLKDRPGEFARMLDKVLRDSTNKNYIINCFKDVADKISTPVLLQVWQHFSGRAECEKYPVRVFFPKGNVARAIVVKNELPTIEEKFCEAIQKICGDALIENYKKKEYIGNVYVDEEFKNYLVPFSQRSASKTTKSIVRGSKVPVNNTAKAVRAFIWWTNTLCDRVDIDLSACIFDAGWNYVEHISYTNLRSVCYKACHSGDITNGGGYNGKGAAEFIDIDIDSVNKHGRYVVFQVYSYTGQKYSEIQNVRFGWMERKDVNSGEIFEPKTVAMSMDVTAESTVAIPVIFDCLEKKFIWCDMNLSLNNVSNNYGGNNVESNISGVAATCYGLTHLNKANLYSLITFNAVARGKIVNNRNEADIIFSNDTTKPVEYKLNINPENGNTECVEKEKDNVVIVSAFDTDYYMGQLL